MGEPELQKDLEQLLVLIGVMQQKDRAAGADYELLHKYAVLLACYRRATVVLQLKAKGMLDEYFNQDINDLIASGYIVKKDETKASYATPLVLTHKGEEYASAAARTARWRGVWADFSGHIRLWQRAGEGELNKAFSRAQKYCK